MKIWNKQPTGPTGHVPTDTWLAKQPIWHDRDIIRFVLFGIAIGIIVGFIWGYGVGLPDYSTMPTTFLKG